MTVSSRHRAATVVLVTVVLLVPAACGHRTDTEALVRANLVEGSAPSAASAGEATSSPTVPVVGDTDLGVAGPSAGDGGTPVDPSAGPGDPASGADDGAASCATRDTGSLLIGAVGNLSGPAGTAGAPVVRGLQLWASSINARGGLCGRQVQIVVVDDHTDPAQFRAAIQDLVENRHVVAFSNVAFTTVDAGIPYLESVQVPNIAGCGATPSEFASPIFFLGCAPSTHTSWATAQIVALFGPSSHRLGIVTCREVAACGSNVQRDLAGPDGASAAGMQIVYEAQASIAQPDYTSECQGAKAAGADVLAVFLDPASMRRFGRSCARQDYYPVYSLISGPADSGLATEPGFDRTSILMVSPNFSYLDGRTPAQQEFQQAAADLYTGVVGPNEASGWAGGKMIERAGTIAAQTTGTITSASLIAALHTLDDETFGGVSIPVSFPAGRAGTYPRCSFALPGHEGHVGHAQRRPTALPLSSPVRRARHLPHLAVPLGALDSGST